MYADELMRRYPDIQVDPGVLYIDDGQVLTSAGSAAGLDLCLHLVRRHYGVAVSNVVARRLVLPAHRHGGQAQFIPRPVVDSDNDRLGALMQTVRGRLTRRWDVPGMASEANMSPRSLFRRFKETTGLTPLGWLTAERIDRARELLESGSIGMDELAEQVGFGSVETLRHHFKRRVGVSPGRYRSSFGTSGPNGRADGAPPGNREEPRGKPADPCPRTVLCSERPPEIAREQDSEGIRGGVSIDCPR
jgi:AraC family transcriptional activator FtrA